MIQSDFYNSDVGFLQLGCRIFTTRMSDFYNSDVGFLQLGCQIFTTRMSDFYYSDVGFLQLGCRIFTTPMSDFYDSDVGFFQLRCRSSVSSDSSDASTDSQFVFSTLLFLPRYFLAFSENKNRLKRIKNHRRNSCLPTRATAECSRYYCCQIF